MKLVSPPYTAVMLSTAMSGRLDVLNVAWSGHGDVPQVGWLSIPVPIGDPLLKNVTVPVGIPVNAGVTVAVNVTSCMKVDGFTEEITVVVVVAWLTVTIPFT